MIKSRDDKGSGRPPRAPKGGRDVGAALKKAYEGALREDIPADLLDLLRKLD
ncbi:NepR family anti-sigma factor [Sphingosinicella sp.]|uniref:NepR family anti-sigma factor n=1 Tax=Sphingosinicella sp. TaxID=1917971 RepID=UPI004038483D